MKKLFAVVLALGLMSVPAMAKDKHSYAPRPASLLECGIFFLPANCSPVDRVVGGAIVGAAVGFGVGAIVGASGGAITGGVLAAHTTGAVAGSYAVIGAGAGATTGLLVAR
jgi:hypothetical protein